MKTKLDKDFSKIVDDISIKLSKASELIKEANKLLQNNDCGNLSEPEINGSSLSDDEQDRLYGQICDSVDDLMRSLEDVGWETSSMGC